MGAPPVLTQREEWLSVPLLGRVCTVHTAFVRSRCSRLNGGRRAEGAEAEGRAAPPCGRPAAASPGAGRAERALEVPRSDSYPRSPEGREF